MKKTVLVLLMLFSAIALLSVTAWGATRTWKGGTSTDWATASNWNENAVPGSSDAVVFDASPTQQPTISSSTSVASITIASTDNITLTLNNSSPVALTLGGGSAVLTINASGQLTVTSTSTGTNAATIVPGGTTPTGSIAGTLTISGRIAIGGGSAAITVPNGGILNVNRSGSGIGGPILASTTLTVQSGGTVNWQGVGSGIAATGTVNFNSGSNFNLTSSVGFSASGKTYGNLSFSGNQTYSISGSSAMTVLNDFSVASGSTLGNGMTAVTGIVVGGTMTVSGTMTNLVSSLVTGAGNFTLASGGTLSTANTLGITSSGSTGTIQVAGTRTYSTGGNYTFNAAAGQVTGNGLPATVNNLTVNNSSGVTLSASTTVAGTLTLTSGNITTGANTLTLGSSSSISGEGTGKYVVGNLATTKAVGTGASTLGGIGVSLDAGGADNLGNVSVTRVSGSGGAVTVGGKTGINRKWTITSDSPPILGRTLTLSWVSDDDNGKGLTTAQLWKSTDAGSTWNPVGSVTDVSGTRSIGVSTTSFSQWTVSDGANLLPVELTSFSALVRGNKVELNWNTATEVNNYGFEIERAIHSGLNSGLNGLRDWQKVGFVEGHGTTNAPQNYSFSDNSTLVGKYSYRLKQIDRDGKFQYSKEVEAAIALAPNTIVLGQNYPNPFNPETNIEFAIPATGRTTLKVYNMLGEEIATLVNGNIEAGVLNHVSFKGSNFPSGMYFYTLRSGNFVETKKMLMVK